MTGPAPTNTGPMIGAVTLPQPPLLLPGLTGRPVVEVEQIRAACVAALRRAAGVDPERIVLIGGHPPDGPAGSRRPDEPPWSVQVGRSLLAEAGLIGPAVPVGRGAELEVLIVPGDRPVEECRSAGGQLADRIGRAQRVLIVVMADGSARRTLKAPGYLDERAEPFDAAVGRLLAAADWPALAELDPALADELMVAGARPWPTFAATLDHLTAGQSLDWAPIEHYTGDPFGVWYPVYSYLALPLTA